jgi:hypothetical protein
MDGGADDLSALLTANIDHLSAPLHIGTDDLSADTDYLSASKCRKCRCHRAKSEKRGPL